MSVWRLIARGKRAGSSALALFHGRALFLGQDIMRTAKETIVEGQILACLTYSIGRNNSTLDHAPRFDHTRRLRIDFDACLRVVRSCLRLVVARGQREQNSRITRGTIIPLVLYLDRPRSGRNVEREILPFLHACSLRSI